MRREWPSSDRDHPIGIQARTLQEAEQQKAADQALAGSRQPDRCAPEAADREGESLGASYASQTDVGLVGTGKDVGKRASAIVDLKIQKAQRQPSQVPDSWRPRHGIRWDVQGRKRRRVVPPAKRSVSLCEARFYEGVSQEIWRLDGAICPEGEINGATGNALVGIRGDIQDDNVIRHGDGVNVSSEMDVSGHGQSWRRPEPAPGALLGDELADVAEFLDAQVAAVGLGLGAADAHEPQSVGLLGHSVLVFRSPPVWRQCSLRTSRNLYSNYIGTILPRRPDSD